MNQDLHGAGTYITQMKVNMQLKVLAISGSTRASSSNLNVIKAVAALAEGEFGVEVYEGLTSLPHFNPDIDNETPPQEIVEFRRKVREANGVLICTPEYALGVPGSLKNAIDWTVSSMEFNLKPVALITAGLSGKVGHQSLLGTLLMIDCKISKPMQIVIPYVKTKINHDAQITDAETLSEVNELISSFTAMMTNPDEAVLSAPLLMNVGVQ
jgi:chromate reductase, NAD(P)H dehydrogenase (quinone)